MICASSRRSASRVPSSTMPPAAPTTSAPLLRNAADLDAMTFRQRVMVDVSKVSLATTLLGRPGFHAARDRPDRTCGPVPCRRRDTAARGRRRLRHSLLPEHHVDLLDRGCARGQQAALLVSAIPDERSRLQSRADRPRPSRAVFGVDAHARFTGYRRTPPRSAQRTDHPAANDAAQCLGYRDQALLGACGCCSASGARSAIWSAGSAAPAASIRWPSGPRRNSTRRRIGAMWNGCAAAGRAS